MLTRILFTDDVEPATSNRKFNTAHARYIVGSSLRLRFRITKNLKVAKPRKTNLVDTKGHNHDNNAKMP